VKSEVRGAGVDGEQHCTGEQRSERSDAPSRDDPRLRAQHRCPHIDLAEWLAPTISTCLIMVK
jgi:hypothetical protein